MKAAGYKPSGYCGSSVQKTETKTNSNTNTKNCGSGGANFSAVLSQAKSSCKSPPAASNKAHKGDAGHGHSHHGHAHSAHGKHTHAHHSHKHSHHGKSCAPHFGHKAFHKGLSLFNFKSCSSVKPAPAPTAKVTGGTTVQAQKTVQLTVQSQTYMAVNYNRSFSYSVANAVSSSLNSLKSIGSYNFTGGMAGASVSPDSMLAIYKMLMKHFIENKSEGAASLDDLYVENGKIMGLPPILDKIINSIQTAKSENPDEKPDDAKSILKEILAKGVKNIPDLKIEIAVKKEESPEAQAA